MKIAWSLQRKVVSTFTFSRCMSQMTNADVRRRRCQLFDGEERRQRSLVGRVEKIEVQYFGVPESCTLVMNKDISTPYNCAQHIAEPLMQRAVLAEVNGEPWDVHRPLTDSCSLSYLFFTDEDPFHVNKAFWRSCSLMLGAVVDQAFKDQHYVQLHSFPGPNVRSGSFVYDVRLPLDAWSPNPEEMRVFSAMMRRLASQNLPFRRLDVSTEVALELFGDNEYKREQVPSIAEKSETGDRVTVYRVGDHVDMSRGPVMAHTGLMGRCTVTAVHHIQTDVGPLYRFQGVALPCGVMLNHFAYGLLEERARLLNTARLPSASMFHTSAAAVAQAGLT